MEKLRNVVLDIFVTLSVVDAANIFTGLKTVSFIVVFLLYFLSYGFKSNHVFKMVCLIELISVISFIFGRIYGYDYDSGMYKQYTFSFFMLLVLMWDKNISISKIIYLPSFILSIGTILLYIIFYFYPEYKYLISAYTDTDPPVILISERTFLGIKFDGVFYTPLMFIVIPACLSLYKLLFEKKRRINNLLWVILFLVSLFIGGNRGCLLSLVFILSMALVFLLRKCSKKIFMIAVPVSLCLFIYLTFMLLSEKEESNEVKSNHLETYMKILEDRPTVYITGMGPGSKVYSKGFHSYTPLMEWTYLELIRFYGLGSLVILYLFYNPVIYLYKHRAKFKYGLPISLGCGLYMVSAFGNPFLINSTGMVVLIYISTYIKHEKTKAVLNHGRKNNC